MFAKENGDRFHARFFMSIAEVPLCRHTTVVMFHVLKNTVKAKKGYHIMIAKAGEFKVQVSDRIWIQLLPPKILGELDENVLKKCLNIQNLLILRLQ